jgi:hypothetical protein
MGREQDNERGGFSLTSIGGPSLIEFPRKVELVFNLQTAKVSGLRCSHRRLVALTL